MVSLRPTLRTYPPTTTHFRVYSPPMGRGVHARNSRTPSLSATGQKRIPTDLLTRVRAHAPAHLVLKLPAFPRRPEPFRDHCPLDDRNLRRPSRVQRQPPIDRASRWHLSIFADESKRFAIGEAFANPVLNRAGANGRASEASFLGSHGAFRGSHGARHHGPSPRRLQDRRRDTRVRARRPL